MLSVHLPPTGSLQLHPSPCAWREVAGPRVWSPDSFCSSLMLGALQALLRPPFRPHTSLQGEAKEGFALLREPWGSQDMEAWSMVLGQDWGPGDEARPSTGTPSSQAPTSNQGGIFPLDKRDISYPPQSFFVVPGARPLPEGILGCRREAAC